MCLAVPAKVISIDGTSALVSIGGVQYTASLMLLEDVRPGDYVLLHAGFAIEKIDPEEAAETMRLLLEIENSNP
jgi:hydrogenase expression/formation protein HypC